MAGWMWMNPEEKMSGADKVIYTTGRLTSEMVIKSAQMGVPIVVSRSGITQMGLDVAQRLGLCAIGCATNNKRFLWYSGAQRLILQPELAGMLAAALNADLNLSEPAVGPDSHRPGGGPPTKYPLPV